MIKIKYESATLAMIIEALTLEKIFSWEPMSKTFYCWFIYCMIIKPTFLYNKKRYSIPSFAESNHQQVFLLFLQGKTFQSLR